MLSSALVLFAQLASVDAQQSSPRVTPDAPRPIVVASKPFGESYILAEMFAQVLEAHGIAVARRAGLGATEIAFAALRTGAIDVYPEYTGTGLIAILHRPPVSDARAAFRIVSQEFTQRWGVQWLPPLGFQNTYAIAVTRATAQRHGLRTLTDLARAAPQLTAGLTPDFVGRADGLPGLQRAYGMRFREVRSLLQAVKYQALAAGSVDVVDGYSTDALILRYDLIVLEDDRGFFPPYEAAALVSNYVRTARPDVSAALASLSGQLDEATMRALNQRVEVNGESVEDVARGALGSLGLSGARNGQRGGAGAANPGGNRFARSPNAERQELLPFLWERRSITLALASRHMMLVAVSLGAAILVGLSLGLLLERFRAQAETVVRVVGVLQTIPGIALLAFMIPLLGIGVLPAIVALFLYSLYPIVRNTYTGVRTAAPDAVAAAEALGMTAFQRLRYVRLPLAAPVIMAGIRTAAVIAVGTATLAAFIGAGGLGDPIVAGLALSDTRLILSGAIPAALLAIAVDALLALLERAVAPRGV